MATYFARATGNINGTIWATTPSGTASNLFGSFTSSDVLVANSFTVTINVNTTVLEIRNDNFESATSGGTFNFGNGITLTSNIVGTNTGTAATVTYNGGSNGSSTIVGSITGGVTTSTIGALVFGGVGGTLNIIGNLAANGSAALEFRAGGTVNITGNVTSGPGNTSTIFWNATSNSTLNITGNVTGGSSTGFAINLAVSGNTINIVGTSVGGATSAGLSISAAVSSPVTVTRVKGNGFGNGSVGLSSTPGLINNSQNSIVKVYEIEYGDLGQSPTNGPVFLEPASTNVALFYRPNETKKTLVSPDSSSGLLPNTSDVRAGIVYSTSYIGSMNVPNTASVASGVSVDNTTGTALLTIDNIAGIWNFPTSGIGVTDSIGDRLKNCSTVATMGTQLASVVNNL